MCCNSCTVFVIFIVYDFCWGYSAKVIDVCWEHSTLKRTFSLARQGLVMSGVSHVGRCARVLRVVAWRLGSVTSCSAALQCTKILKFFPFLSHTNRICLQKKEMFEVVSWITKNTHIPSPLPPPAQFPGPPRPSLQVCTTQPAKAKSINTV